MARRLSLEEMNASIAKEIARLVPKGMGFALMMFDFGEGGSIGYVSNAQRSTMMSALRELLAKWDAEGT